MRVETSENLSMAQEGAEDAAPVLRPPERTEFDEEAQRQRIATRAQVLFPLETASGTKFVIRL